MSVSFYPEVQDAPTRLACSCEEQVGETIYKSRSEAYNAVYTTQTATVPVCGDELCAAYSVSFVEVNETPYVNVSNFNASAILDVLGIQVGEDFDYRCAGSMDAEDFLGRVLLADAVQPVSAELPSYREGNLIRGAREEGYVNSRVNELREVAEYARARSLKVCWG